MIRGHSQRFSWIEQHISSLYRKDEFRGDYSITIKERAKKYLE